MIHAFTEFEHVDDQCTVSETRISAAFFGSSLNWFKSTLPKWTVNSPRWLYGSVTSPHGTALPASICKDLLARTRLRRRGLARALLAAECLDNSHTGLSWAVLNWNSAAIALY